MSDKADIGNCSSLSFSERQNHYAKCLGIEDVDSVCDKFDILNIAYKQTCEEMINEIHTMLRYVIEKNHGEVIDD